MPVLDPAAIAGIISDLLVNIASYAGIAALLYAIGGILIRTIGWTFDKMLINFIGMFYKYFETIIDGTLLTDDIVSGMMNRVYLLVGVFVVFRLGMLLINYIINPSEVMDEKVGVNALIKRVILGLILIIFMPNIFGYAFRLQKAILADQVIERIIMSDAEMLKVDDYKKKHGMGKILGMTVFRGFFSLSSDASSNGTARKNFEKATDIKQDYDLSVIDSLGSGLGGGILYEVNGEYAHDYFPIFSTVVLCYVLYLLVQYCLDAVVRSFKLSVLQVIAPVCIVEYMINGDRNEVFKSWRKAVVSTFAMLFMRVASIWFVAYVTMLMQPGMISGKSLLQTQDNLLKAVIVLGLLAFMMDFPKMMSDVFGLDLDQSGAVKNVMGKAMGAATAGLAIGGAAAGLGMKAAKATKGTLKGGLTNLAGAKSSFAKGLNNPFKTGANQMGALAGNTAAGIGALAKKAKNPKSSLKDNYAQSKDSINKGLDKVKNSAPVQKTKAVGQKAKEVGGVFAQAAKENNLGTTLKKGGSSVFGAVVNSNQVTKSAIGSYSDTTKGIQEKIEQQDAKASEQIFRQRQIEVMDQINATSTASYGMQVASGAKLDAIADNTEQTVTQTVNIQQQLGTISGNVQAVAQNTETTAQQIVNVDQKLGTVSGNVQAIAQNTETTAQQTVNIDQKLGTISSDVREVAGNTEVAAIETLDINQKLGNGNSSSNN